MTRTRSPSARVTSWTLSTTVSATLSAQITRLTWEAGKWYQVRTPAGQTGVRSLVFFPARVQKLIEIDRAFKLPRDALSALQRRDDLMRGLGPTDASSVDIVL
jgi:hypothetical protein